MKMWEVWLLIGFAICPLGMAILYACLVAAVKAEKRDNEWRKEKHERDL